MSNLKSSLPGEPYYLEAEGPIALITAQIDETLAIQINNHLKEIRMEAMKQHPSLKNQVGYLRNDYRVETKLNRLSSGEGQAVIVDSITGHDIFILTDVLYTGTSYYNREEMLTITPDEQYTDLMRTVLATQNLGQRINIIMPYLYQGRKYRHEHQSSMDCAQMLIQLFNLGIANFITFDAHDDRIGNAVPGHNFESFTTSLQLMQAILHDYPSLELNSQNLIAVSPNEHTVNRCTYYANIMKIPVGIFYKYRSFSPTGLLSETTQYLGTNVEGKDVLIIDDMLVTGRTFLHCIEYLKDQGARRIIGVASFAQFTQGISRIQEAYENGYFDKIYTTNASYISTNIRSLPWLSVVDLSKYMARIIDTINHNGSLTGLINPDARIEDLLSTHSLEQRLF